MTKKEREELKKEIVVEVLRELNKNKSNDFDFEGYKKHVNKDDIKKVESFLKKGKRWHWFIPFWGFFAYLRSFTMALAGIDRGALKVAITKYQMSNFGWYFILYSGIGFIFNLSPLVDFKILRKAVEEVKGELHR